jgi:hypothetical protein
MAAIFVVVSVVLPLKQNEFTSYKHQLFAAAVAYSAATPLDRVLIQRIVQVRRSIGNSVQIISEIAVLEEKELKRILERVNTDSLNKELADLGLPQGAVSSVSVKNAKPDVSTSQQASNTNLIIGLVFGALSFIVIVVVIASLALQKKLESKEEREHKLKASEIRSFFKIRKSDGYVLISESVPFRLRRENVCFMHKTSLDAVVHLALFQDFEVGHIDSFCLCLVDSECDSDCKERYQLFCEWILGIAVKLIQPDIKSLRSDSTESDETDYTSSVRVYQRFNFFQKKVIKCQVWMDNNGTLFSQLKSAALKLMEQIALVCDSRTNELRQEPKGEVLFQVENTESLLWEVQTDSTPVPRQLKASAKENLAAKDDECISADERVDPALQYRNLMARQDHPSVSSYFVNS